MSFLSVTKAVLMKLRVMERAQIDAPAKQARILALVCLIGGLMLPAIPSLFMAHNLRESEFHYSTLRLTQSVDDVLIAQKVKDMMKYVPEADRPKAIEAATYLQSEAELDAKIKSLRSDKEARAADFDRASEQRDTWRVLLGLAIPMLLSWFLLGLGARFVAAWRGQNKQDDIKADDEAAPTGVTGSTIN